MRSYPNHMIEARDTIEVYESGGEVCIRFGGPAHQVILTMGHREAQRLLDALADLVDWSGPRTLDGHVVLPMVPPPTMGALIEAAMGD